MRERAESYGIPLSLLVLKAVEAYTRTYEDDVGDVAAVAVNYGVWRRVDSGLGDIEAVLREATQQLVGIRWTLNAAMRAGRMSEEDYRSAFRTLGVIRDDVSRMREDVARCTELIDRICEAAHLVDPYLGPMEPEGADGISEGSEIETGGW